MSNQIGMNCPHCGNRGRVRTSVEKSATMRELYFYCTEMFCGHSWVATLEAIRTISPPSQAFKNPNINLPVVKDEDVYLLHDQFKAAVSGQRSIFEIFKGNEEKPNEDSQ